MSTQTQKVEGDVTPEMEARRAIIQRIIEFFGGQHALARALTPPIHQTTVWLWKANGDIPPERHIQVIEASEDFVSQGLQDKPLTLKDFIGLPSGEPYVLALRMKRG